MSALFFCSALYLFLCVTCALYHRSSLFSIILRPQKPINHNQLSSFFIPSNDLDYDHDDDDDRKKGDVAIFSLNSNFNSVLLYDDICMPLFFVRKYKKFELILNWQYLPEGNQKLSYF